MAAVVRTLVYLTIIGALLLLLVPVDGLQQAAVLPGTSRRGMQLAGVALTLAGAGLWLWCALTFALLGRGTPLPFDPPRRLVVSGPYRVVRNPMAIGAGSAVLGVAVYYGSWPIFLFACVLMLGIHAFVVLYEEPTLLRLFGAEYAEYRAGVNRWWPRMSGRGREGAGSTPSEAER